VKRRKVSFPLRHSAFSYDYLLTVVSLSHSVDSFIIFSLLSISSSRFVAYALKKLSRSFYFSITFKMFLTQLKIATSSLTLATAVTFPNTGAGLAVTGLQVNQL
jgi:hypothetical protein